MPSALPSPFPATALQASKGTGLALTSLPQLPLPLTARLAASQDKPHGVFRRRHVAVSAVLFNSPKSPQAPPADAPAVAPGTVWVQKFIELPSMKRGCHIITRYILKGAPEIEQFSVGLCHIFVMHTSCSLTINENASPDVPLDMEDALNRIAPEGDMYRHLDEGYDDMPAHVKASLMGSSLTVPIAQGRLALGTWQGIWLNEHRDYGGSRRLVITMQGCRGAE